MSRAIGSEAPACCWSGPAGGGGRSPAGRRSVRPTALTFLGGGLAVVPAAGTLGQGLAEPADLAEVGFPLVESGQHQVGGVRLVAGTTKVRAFEAGHTGSIPVARPTPKARAKRVPGESVTIHHDPEHFLRARWA